MDYKGVQIKRCTLNNVSNIVGHKVEFYNEKLQLTYSFKDLKECKEYIDYLKEVELI